MNRPDTAGRIGFAAAAIAAVFAASPAQAMDDQVFINSGDIKWGAAPPTLPKGAKIAVLYGDPGKPGPFTLRLATPANYRIAPHWHSLTENLTVVSGTLYLGMGDKLDRHGSQTLQPGGFVSLPATMHHFGWTATPTVVQISLEGPFDIFYVNPADNPQKPLTKR